MSRILVAAVFLLPLAQATAQQRPVRPVANLRIETPLGSTFEFGGWRKRYSGTSNGETGSMATIGIGQFGFRVAAGTRWQGLLGVQFVKQVEILQMTRDNDVARAGQTYLGGEVRAGILFTTIGVGLAVRVLGPAGTGTEPRRGIFLASLGIGL